MDAGQKRSRSEEGFSQVGVPPTKVQRLPTPRFHAQGYCQRYHMFNAAALSGVKIARPGYHAVLVRGLFPQEASAAAEADFLAPGSEGRASDAVKLMTTTFKPLFTRIFDAVGNGAEIGGDRNIFIKCYASRAHFEADLVVALKSAGVSILARKGELKEGELDAYESSESCQDGVGRSLAEVKEESGARDANRIPVVSNVDVGVQTEGAIDIMRIITEGKADVEQLYGINASLAVAVLSLTATVKSMQIDLASAKQQLIMAQRQ